MALSVTEVEELRNYFKGVMDRADHHAGNVNEIALALMGAILWRKNDDEPIKVLVNVLWVRIGKDRYAFSFKHETGVIEMRKGSTQGPTLHAFTNATPLAEVRRIFAAL